MSDADQRFAPPTAHVEDVAVMEGEAELASRGMRFLAMLADVLIAMAIGWVLSKIPAYKSLGLDAHDSGLLGWSMNAVAGFVLFLVLHGWLLVTRGQTIGKMLCGLRIVRSDGSKPDAWRLLGLRYGLGYLLSTQVIVGGVFGLLDALLIFRESRKCLHDTIADTKVIKL